MTVALLRALLCFSFVLCYVATAIHGHHMHQLNGYKARVHLTWLRRHFAGVYLVRHWAAFLGLLLSLWGLPAASAAAYAAQAYVNRPREAKKPLVYTARVTRMIATHAVLVASAVAFSCSLGLRGQSLLLAFCLSLSPFFVLLANLLNAPLERSINRWYVNDARRRLREMPALIVVGVTGSYGKTSTKYFLQRLLSGRYNVLMTPESYNTTLGVVKTIRTQLRPIHEVFVCEMGARNRGDVREICDLVRPRYGVITSIGPQHLDSFRTVENVAATKFELADAVPAEGAVFLNHDNEFIRARECGKRVVSYSAFSGGTDYAARDIRVSASGSSFSVTLANGEERRFETRLIGRHNVQNLVAAIAVADFLGVGPDDIAMGVRRLEAVPHRLQLSRRGNIIIIDDAYNSNESGAKAALDVLAMFDGFKILATPGMVELGEKQDELNRRFGRQAAEVCDLVVPVGERQTASFVAGLREGGYSEERIRPAENLKRAFEIIERADALGRTKVVLLENDLPDNY